MRPPGQDFKHVESALFRLERNLAIPRLLQAFRHHAIVRAVSCHLRFDRSGAELLPGRMQIVAERHGRATRQPKLVVASVRQPDLTTSPTTPIEPGPSLIPIFLSLLLCMSTPSLLYYCTILYHKVSHTKVSEVRTICPNRCAPSIPKGAHPCTPRVRTHDHRGCAPAYPKGAHR